VTKHLLDETAELALPRAGRHAAPDTGELEITQRFHPGLRPGRPAPAPQPARDQSR
jgi:hypothetical protein